MSKKNKQRLIVTSRHGRHRFQRGLVTASFVQRGMGLSEAMLMSARVKRELEDRDEVDAGQIRKMIDVLTPKGLNPGPSKRSGFALSIVRQDGTSIPFLKADFIASLRTVGLDFESAFGMAQDAELWIHDQAGLACKEEEFYQYVADILHGEYGEQCARRFELLGWIPRTDRPIIILLGGATGTGKSTVATELAARLKIRTITGTDMIRETMRIVLPSTIVPGLHGHSFRTMVESRQILSNPRERALFGFHQQAQQVGVAVRAVIRRAIKEQSNLIVEGTHLVPPFENYIPYGAEVHFAGLLLSVHSERMHRRRFPRRARKATGRTAADYLDAFQAVRWIHDDLVQLAESSEEFVISNLELNQTLVQAVSYLSESLPSDPLSASRPPVKEQVQHDIPKTVFLILDGLADEPNPALSDRTPLEAANTPILNSLSASGGLGQVSTTPPSGTIPNTDEGLVALLRPAARLAHVGRGLFEALGQGIPLSRNAIVFRGNLATVQEDGTIIDRRAGRIRAGVGDLLAGLTDITLSNGVIGSIYPGHEHRVIVLLRGSGLSTAVCNTDPGGSARISLPIAAEATDDSDSARKTARALQELLLHARGHLSNHPVNLTRSADGLYQANTIITRGAASVDELPDLRFHETNMAVVSACSTALGVARALGYLPVTSREMTGNMDTNMNAKFDRAGELLSDHDLVAIHFKGTDIAAHDCRPLEKKAYIERVDEALGVFLAKREGLRVIVSADHGTSSRTGDHLPDPVPVLLSVWEGLGETVDFNEESAAEGVLGLMTPEELHELVMAPN